MKLFSDIQAAVLLAAMAAFVPAIAQMPGRQETSAQDQKMMEQMMRYGTPGKEHELLKNYVGEWDVAISSWKDPLAEPEMTKGTMKNTLMFDGRYLKSDFDFMMGGMKAHGLEIIGYDLFKKM